MGILSDLLHTGINTGMGYGMGQLTNAIPGWVGQDRPQGITNPDQSPMAETDRPPQQSALGSSGLDQLDPLTKMAMRNMMQGAGNMMQPSQGGGLLSTLMRTGIQALPMALSML